MTQAQLDVSTPGPTVEQVLASLRRLRVQNVGLEYDLQAEIARQFTVDVIPFAKEFKLAPRNRIDFLVPGGIGIECKKGKPDSGRLAAQVERYCGFDSVTVVIMAVERNIFNYSPMVNGKPVHYVALNKLWGIAL